MAEVLEDFDFGVPPEADAEKDALKQEVSELKVLIDTLQTNLRTAETIICKYEPKCSLFNVPSYKWCTTWSG